MPQGMVWLSWLAKSCRIVPEIFGKKLRKACEVVFKLASVNASPQRLVSNHDGRAAIHVRGRYRVDGGPAEGGTILHEDL